MRRANAGSSARTLHCLLAMKLRRLIACNGGGSSQVRANIHTTRGRALLRMPRAPSGTSVSNATHTHMDAHTHHATAACFRACSEGGRVIGMCISGACVCRGEVCRRALVILLSPERLQHSIPTWQFLPLEERVPLRGHSSSATPPPPPCPLPTTRQGTCLGVRVCMRGTELFAGVAAWCSAALQPRQLLCSDGGVACAQPVKPCSDQCEQALAVRSFAGTPRRSWTPQVRRR